MTLRVVCSENDNEVPYQVMQEDQVVRPVYQFLQTLHLRGMALETSRAYAYDLLHFWRFLERHQLKLESFSQQDFVTYLLQHKKTHAPRTINRRLIVIRDFLNSQCDGRGDTLVCRDPQASYFKGIKNKALVGPVRMKSRFKKTGRPFSIKIPAKIFRTLNSCEIKQFLSCLRCYRDQLIVYLMLFAGLRTCEVLSLEIDDVDLTASKMVIKGKGKKERVLPLCAAIQKSFHHFIHYERPKTVHQKVITVLKGPRRGRPLTREGLRNIFRYWRRATKLSQAHPHMFRHTFCSNLIAQGVSLPVVQKLMGHSDIEVTMMYVHMGIDDVTREYYQAIQALQKM